MDISAVLIAIGSAVLFGLSSPVAKILLDTSDPWMLAGILYSGAGIGLLLVHLAIRGIGALAEARLTRRELPWLAAAVLSGGVIGPVLLLVGLVRVNASAASLLLTLEGVLTALLAWFVFKENFDRRIALGMLSIVAGAVALSWEGRLMWGGLAGPLAVGGACLCWAIDNNLTQKVSAGDPVQIAMLKGLVAGSVNTAIAFPLGATLPG